MPKKTEEQLNVVEESVKLKLTEWEFDTICQLVMGIQFPATHVDIANRLIQKLKKVYKGMTEKKNGSS